MCNPTANLSIDLYTVPMEFKAGQTVAGDWVHNLRRYLDLAASRAPAVPVVDPLVIYGGDAPQIRDGIEIKGWRGLPELALRLLGDLRTDSA